MELEHRCEYKTNKKAKRQRVDADDSEQRCNAIDHVFGHPHLVLLITHGLGWVDILRIAPTQMHCAGIAISPETWRDKKLDFSVWPTKSSQEFVETFNTLTNSNRSRFAYAKSIAFPRMLRPSQYLLHELSTALPRLKELHQTERSYMWSHATIRYFMQSFPSIEKLYVRGYNWDFETILFQRSKATQLKIIDCSYGFYDHFVEHLHWVDIWQKLPYLTPSLQILRIKLHPAHFCNHDVGCVTKIDECLRTLHGLPTLQELDFEGVSIISDSGLKHLGGTKLQKIRLCNLRSISAAGITQLMSGVSPSCVVELEDCIEHSNIPAEDIHKLRNVYSSTLTLT